MAAPRPAPRARYETGPPRAKSVPPAPPGRAVRSPRPSGMPSARRRAASAIASGRLPTFRGARRPPPRSSRTIATSLQVSRPPGPTSRAFTATKSGRSLAARTWPKRTRVAPVSARSRSSASGGSESTQRIRSRSRNPSTAACATIAWCRAASRSASARESSSPTRTREVSSNGISATRASARAASGAATASASASGVPIRTRSPPDRADGLAQRRRDDLGGGGGGEPEEARAEGRPVPLARRRPDRGARRGLDELQLDGDRRRGPLRAARLGELEDGAEDEAVGLERLPDPLHVLRGHRARRVDLLVAQHADHAPGLDHVERAGLEQLRDEDPLHLLPREPLLADVVERQHRHPPHRREIRAPVRVVRRRARAAGREEGGGGEERRSCGARRGAEQDQVRSVNARKYRRVWVSGGGSRRIVSVKLPSSEAWRLTRQLGWTRTRARWVPLNASSDSS